MSFRSQTITLTPGQTFNFSPLLYWSIKTSTGVVEVSVQGEDRFASADQLQIWGDGKAADKLLVFRAPATGGTITFTVLTSDTLWRWTAGAGNTTSVSLDAATITLPVSVAGVATAANQTTANAALSAIQTATATTAANGATSALQTTAAASLANIDGDIGAKADASASTDAGTFSLIALVKRLLGKLTAQLPAALGQTTKSASLPVTIASDQGNLATNVAQINGVAPLMGSGVNGTGAQRVTLATDQAACSVAGLFSVKIDQTTHGTTDKVAADLYVGGAAVTANYGTAAATNPRVVLGTPTGSTFVNAAATNNAGFAKASAGQLFSITANNASAAAKYVRIFNKASAPTMGTDVPVLVITIPASSSKEFTMPQGLSLGTGIAYAITGGATTLDNTSTAAGDVQMALSWQ